MDKVEDPNRTRKSLFLLRLQLYTAMQQLKGDDLRNFWALIDEIVECRDAFVPGGS